MRSLFSIVGIILAGAVFFMYTKPAYDTIQVSQNQITQYNAALDKSTQLQTLKQSLLSRYNAINPTDLTRLQTLLPDQVNNIALILDLDTLASQFGMSLENVNISSSGGSGSNTNVNSKIQNTTAVGAAGQPFDSLDVQFSIHGTYAQFLQFISNLESSLRIVDLVGLTVSGGGAANTTPSTTLPGITGGGATSDSIVYTFSITLRTYWLK
jgi:Tfp pilus assembly protein PilO